MIFETEVHYSKQCTSNTTSAFLDYITLFSFSLDFQFFNNRHPEVRRFGFNFWNVH
jgi:hypothetical protein